MPRSVFEEMQEYAETWSSRGIRAWEEGWWDMAVSTGDLLAPVLGVGQGEVSLHQNVTIAEAIVFSSLCPTPERNKVVYSELNFPSIQYFYQSQPDIELHVTDCPDAIEVPLERLLDAIDERTLLVPISHVIFRSSFLQDVRAITQKAHEVGALVLLDAYQSCGTVPFSANDLSVDFLVGGSVKWLCGGPGVAYLWVEPGLRDRLEPRLTGWMAHERPFGFESTMEYSRSAFRFLNGTPNVPGLYAARSGYRIVSEVGVDRIRAHSLELTGRVIEMADEFGFLVNSPTDPASRGGTVVVRPPNSEIVSRKLIERGILIDHRPDAGIRIGPHFYNTLEEVEHAMNEMKEITEAVS
jgi:kynureninase